MSGVAGLVVATIPSLVVLAAFNMSRLVKARQAGYGEGVVMAVWGIALCILGVAVVADAGAWALWLLGRCRDWS